MDMPDRQQKDTLMRAIVFILRIVGYLMFGFFGFGLTLAATYSILGPLSLGLGLAVAVLAGILWNKFVNWIVVAQARHDAKFGRSRQPSASRAVGTRELSGKERQCMFLINGRDGNSARMDNLDEWLPLCREVLGRRALASYMAYQDDQQRKQRQAQQREDWARHKF